MALQYGGPLKALVEKFSHMRFEPSGWTKNPDIQLAKSVPDYIFRWLGMQFIPGYREAHAPKQEADQPGEDSDNDDGGSPAAAVRVIHDVLAAHNVPAADNNGLHHNGSNGQSDTAAVLPYGAAVSEENTTDRSQQFAAFQADAPVCDNCGAITVRNGNCHLCHNCGNSMGCS